MPDKPEIPAALREALDVLEARDAHFGGPRKGPLDRPTIPWMRADRARAMAAALRWADATYCDKPKCELCDAIAALERESEATP